MTQSSVVFAWWNQPPSHHYNRIRLNRRWRKQIIQFFAGEIGKLASLGTGYLVCLDIVIELVSCHAKLCHSLGNRVFSRRFRLCHDFSRIAVEQRAAAREIEDSRRNADVEARQLMAEAEQRAGEETEKILARARTECEKMQSAARANLERAAQWIAEEVVNDKWQS